MTESKEVKTYLVMELQASDAEDLEYWVTTVIQKNRHRLKGVWSIGEGDPTEEILAGVLTKFAEGLPKTLEVSYWHNHLQGRWFASVKTDKGDVVFEKNRFSLAEVSDEVERFISKFKLLNYDVRVSYANLEEVKS